MTKFSEEAIREAAYYIWKNGDKKYDCGMDNWNAAINQLRAQNAAAVLKQGQMFGTAKNNQTNILRAASLLKKTSVR